ncbi:MAG: hypothetical protein EPO62_09610 [Candidatus Nitrosotenuis sp.]|nr:MAG: hypothetical protein EPO62_09610 [Candidatus Nitrosotenuis sp.]
MHKSALFFMLALTASMIAVLSEPVFAEEMTGDVTSADNSTSDATSQDSQTGEQTVDEGSSDQTMSEEPTADSTSMETTMEPHIDSPLKQMSMGVDPHQIQCHTGYHLVFKASNWNPACVKESSFQTLSAWGWIANHDPSQDELAKMMEDHMAKYPQEPEQTPAQGTQADMEENMDVKDDSSSTNSTSTDQPAPQSHTVDLSESMEMGAQ